MTAAAGIALTVGIGIQFGGESMDFVGDGLFKELARATSHGIAQGGLAEISGGDFGSSFLAGFSGSIAGSMMEGTKTGRTVFGRTRSGWDGGRIVTRTVAASVVGGTVSQLGGGKFANGAASAAMVHLFNAEMKGQRASESEMKEYLDSLSLEGDGDYSRWGGLRSEDPSLIAGYMQLYRESRIGLRLVYDVQIALAESGKTIDILYGLESSFKPYGNMPDHRIVVGSGQYASAKGLVDFGRLEAEFHELFHARDFLYYRNEYSGWAKETGGIWHSHLEYRAVRATNAFRQEQGRGDTVRVKY